MVNTPVKTEEKGAGSIHPGVQFLIFIGIFIGALVIGNVTGFAIISSLYGLETLSALQKLDLSAPHFLNALWILQVTGTTLPFLSAPLFFAWVIVREPQEYIRATFKFSWILPVLILAIMFISNPLMELLSNINQKMVLPHFLQWMRESEDSAQKLTQAMLKMDNIWDMIVRLLFVGLLTAIVEEFTFRGVLQTIFFRWFKNIHVAIWTIAVLFSAFHMEFFGFLPRLMLGVLFGYFVAWSGSIWTSVWAHFINNGTAVVVTYLYQHKLIKVNPDDQHLFSYSGYIVSLAIVLFLLYAYRKTTLGEQPIPEY